MRIAIITSIMLPMPPVKGGAVQNLIKLYLDNNEISEDDKIVVYSFYDKNAILAAEGYRHTTFRYVSNNRFLEKAQQESIKGLSGLAFRIRENIYIHSIIASIKKLGDDFDVILLENCPQFAPHLKKHFPENKIYTHLHNDYVNSTCKFTRQVVEATDRFICVSEYISCRVRTTTSSCDIITVLNGVKIRKDASDRNLDLRKEYNIAEDDFVIIFTGRLVKEKGAHLLLKSIENMDTIERIKILFLGSKLYGQNITDSYMKHLQSLAAPYQDRIIFTGFVPYDKIANYYQIADVGVLLSLWDDPCPLTVIEYLTFGLPVVTTRSGGIPEIVDKNCAFIFDRDENLLFKTADAIQRLRDDSSLLEKMSAASRKRAEFFTQEMYLNRLRNALIK